LDSEEVEKFVQDPTAERYQEVSEADERNDSSDQDRGGGLNVDNSVSPDEEALQSIGRGMMAKYQKPFVKTEFFDKDKRQQEAMRLEREELRGATVIESFYGRYEGLALGTNIHKCSVDNMVKKDVVLGDLIE